MAENLLADASGAPVATSQNADAGSSTSSVPVEDYPALKHEVETLKKRVDSQDKQLAATSQQTAPNATTGQNGSPAPFFSHNNVDERVATLFAPRTGKEYFSPLT